jgi:hypothetical protein
MDEFRAPKMSEEYKRAMFTATVVLQELGPKLSGNTSLTPQEGTRLLNAQWDVYLYAIAERDMQEAKDTAALVDLLSGYLKLSGYNVKFTVRDKYCVTLRKPKKGRN